MQFPPEALHVPASPPALKDADIKKGQFADVFVEYQDRRWGLSMLWVSGVICKVEADGRVLVHVSGLKPRCSAVVFVSSFARLLNCILLS